MPTPIRPLRISQGISRAMPGMSQEQLIFLKTAEFIRAACLFYRKICLLKNRDNAVSFAMGSALDAAVGDHPTVQQIARFTLGSLSIIRCTEDLNQLKILLGRCKRIGTGKHYVALKGDRFGTPSEEMRFCHKLRLQRVIALFQTFGEIFKTMKDLSWHFADAYVAYNENSTSEIFIHSRDLWNELTSDDSFLVRQVNESEQINDWIFGQTNSPLTTIVLMEILSLPARILAILPDKEDVKKTAQDTADIFSRNIQLNFQDWKTSFYEIGGGNQQRRIDNVYYTYKKGSPQDPETTRLISPPRRLSL